MPRFQKNRAERYEELVRELQLVLDNLSKARDLLPDEDLLKSDARRWILVLNILVDAICQKGDLPENDDDDTESESVHMVLSGMDDTVESIRGVLTCAPSLKTAATLQRLRRRVALHTESTSLITGILDRWNVGHGPNAQLELSKIATAYFDQKTHLEARLKSCFQCASVDLLASRRDLPLRASDSFIYPSTSSETLETSSEFFLERLKIEAEKLIPDFSTQTAFATGLRTSIYYLHVLQSSIQMRAEGTNGVDARRLHVNLYKCGWLVHNLIHHNTLRKEYAGKNNLEQIIELILEKLTSAFVAYDKKTTQSAIPFTDLHDCDFALQDPLKYEAQSHEDSSSKGSSLKDISTFSNCAHSDNTQPTSSAPSVSMQSASEKKCVSGERCLAMEVVTAPHEMQVDEPMDLLTASFDSSRSLEKQTWILSTIRILQDQARINGKFRVLICQGEKLLREITVDPKIDQIVHSFAFQSKLPAVWFRQGNKDSQLSFSTNTGVTDLTVFASCFTTDNFDAYFPSISEINIESKKTASKLRFSNLAAQVWTVADFGPRRASSQSAVSVQTQSSELLHHRKESIGAIGRRIEASRILFFCDRSIFTVLVTDQMVCRRDDASTLTLCCKIQGNSLPLYITHGTDVYPAGISLTSGTGSVERSCTDSKIFSAIRVTFPNKLGADAFRKEFELCYQRWLVKAAQLKSHRNLQQNPVIESTSHFHQAGL